MDEWPRGRKVGVRWHAFESVPKSDVDYWPHWTTLSGCDGPGSQWTMALDHQASLEKKNLLSK